MQKFAFKDFKRHYILYKSGCLFLLNHGVEKIAGYNGMSLKYKLLYYITCAKKLILYPKYILIAEDSDSGFYNFMNGYVVHNKTLK